MLASTLPPVLLVGSLVVLLGTLIVAMNMSESYKERAWNEKVNNVGTLIICIGTAIAFLGSVIGAQISTDTTILSWGLLVIAGTAVGGLLAPRIARLRSKRCENKERRARGITH